MKHAGAETLDLLEVLLAQLRRLDGLRERKRGVFYRKGGAFLHFHEDPAGIFAHLKTGPEWERIDITRIPRRRDLIRRICMMIKSDESR